MFGEESVAPEPAIAALPKAVSSRFHGDTGVTACLLQHPGKANCRMCSQRIVCGTERLVWQWHVSKPHSYLHCSCVHRLEEGVVSQAHGLMAAAVNDPKATPSLIDDLEHGMRLATKRLLRDATYSVEVEW